MDRIIREVMDTNRTGLQLITMPTGSGKTFKTNEAIYRYICDDSVPLRDKRNIVVVTTLKKNLAVGDLRDVFVANGKEKLFDETVLFLDSLSETVIDRYRPDMDDAIIGSLGRDRAVTDFLTHLRNIRDSSYGGRENPALKLAKERFASSVEPRFRRKLRLAIRNERHDYDGRLKLIEGSKKWGWVAELYPSVYTRKRKVFFMSADKFVMRNDTIIDKSNTIYDSPIVKDAVIFIDEFDSTRNQILFRLIQNSGRRRIDLVDVILKISAGLPGDNLPSKVFKQHETIRGDLRKDNEFVEKCFRKAIGKHHLDRTIKAEADYQKGKVFIFTSDTKYMVSDVNDSVALEFRKDENRNVLRFFNGDRKSNSRLFYILDDLDYCIDKFCRYISKMAVNYQRNEGDHTISYEDCVLTMLDVHGIGDGTPSYRGYLLERILLGTSSSDNRIEGVDGSVYTSGFGYYVMKDDSSNNERTAIELLSYPVSAERILLKVCEQALVFGMSATAGLRTVLGNYDLDYVRSRLGDRFLPPVEGDERMAEQISASRSRYDRGRIKVVAVSSRDDDGYSDGLWAEVIPEELMGAVADRLDSMDDDYDKERYLQVCKAFAAFLDDPDAHAGLCFCNMHPADGDRDFDRSML